MKLQEYTKSQDNFNRLGIKQKIILFILEAIKAFGILVAGVVVAVIADSKILFAIACFLAGFIYLMFIVKFLLLEFNKSSGEKQ